jgi:hypothetical protein
VYTRDGIRSLTVDEWAEATSKETAAEKSEE